MYVVCKMKRFFHSLSHTKMFPSFFDLVAIILKTSAFSIFWQNSFVSLIEYRANNPVPFTSVYFIRHRVNATLQGNTIKRTHNRAKNRAVWRDKRGRSCAEKGGKGAKGSRRMKKQGTRDTLRGGSLPSRRHHSGHEVPTLSSFH